MSTYFLLIAFGVYFLAAGFGIARRPATARSVIEELRASPALTILTGAFTFFLGAGLIYAHNDWSSPLHGFVSFTGWAAAVEGLLLLAAPDLLYAFADHLAPNDKVARIFGIGTMLIGAGLLMSTVWFYFGH